MLVAPAMDIEPVEVFGLDGDNIADVVSVFVAVARNRPAKFGDNNIFWSRQKHEAVKLSRLILTSAVESLFVVRIAAQPKQFNLEWRVLNINDVPSCARN